MQYNVLRYVHFDLYMFKLERKSHSWCLHVVSTKLALSGKETLSGFANTLQTVHTTFSSIIYHATVPRTLQQPLVPPAGCGEHHITAWLQTWEQSSITPHTDEGEGQGWTCGDPYPSQWLQPLRQKCQGRLSLVPSPNTTCGDGIHDQMIAGGDGIHDQMESGRGCWELQPLSTARAVTSSPHPRTNRLYLWPQSPALIQSFWLHSHSSGCCGRGSHQEKPRDIRRAEPGKDTKVTPQTDRGGVLTRHHYQLKGWGENPNMEMRGAAYVLLAASLCMCQTLPKQGEPEG